MRVLVLTADIGAGHDLPAELLADGIRARLPDAEVAVEDALVAMGPFLRAIGRSGAETILERMPGLFELQYWLLTVFAPTRRLASALLVLVGARGLLRLVRRFRPDVIVSTYPGAPRSSARCGARAASASRASARSPTSPPCATGRTRGWTGT